MQGKVVGLVLAMLLLAPIGQAQWIDDADDDAQGMISGQEVAHGRTGAAEIRAVDIEEDADDLRITISHAPRPDPSGPLMDHTLFQMSFKHGQEEYRLRISYGAPVGDDGAVYYAGLYGGDWDFLEDLEVEPTEEGFTLILPKKSVPDQYGQYPTKGGSLTTFRLVSQSSQSGGSICILECYPLGPSAMDQAPDDGATADYDFQFGLAQDGDIRLSSPAPVRWSNGEATTFVYEILVTNDGTEPDTVVFTATGVPDAWAVADLGPVEVQGGEARSIPIPVKVPFGHVHGSDPRFLLEATGATGTGRIELGVHYPAIPQPTGHHAQVYIHTRTEDVFVFQEGLENALGAGRGAYAYMNTAEDDEVDEDVRASGFKGSTIGGDLDVILDGEVPDYGMVYEWAIPLSPALRVGLQSNSNETTDGSFDLEFDAALGDINVYGNVAVIDEKDLDMGFNFETDLGETIATFSSVQTTPVASSVTVPVVFEGQTQTIAYDPSNQLVMYLKAHIVRPDAPLTPNTGVYLVGGQAVLPLNEHHDAVPVNVSFPEDVAQEAIEGLDSQPAAVEAKDTPAPGLTPALFTIGLAAWRRRALA